MTTNQIFIRKFVFLLRANEEQTHTIIVTRWDASYKSTYCHNSCSHQLIVPVEITYVIGER